MKTELLELLCCPEDHSRLHFAEPALLARLNAGIDSGTLKNRGGQKLDARMETALVRADKKLAYAVIDDIPRMLVDEAIPLDQLDR